MLEQKAKLIFPRGKIFVHPGVKASKSSTPSTKLLFQSLMDPHYTETTYSNIYDMGFYNRTSNPTPNPDAEWIYVSFT